MNYFFFRIGHVVKKLEFPQYSSPKYLKQRIQIKVTDHAADDAQLTETKDIVLNTPNRRNIFENGIGGQKHTVLGIGSFGKVVRGVHKGKKISFI